MLKLSYLYINFTLPYYEKGLIAQTIMLINPLANADPIIPQPLIKLKLIFRAYLLNC